MQKKLIALAVAGLVSGGAFAQSNVTLYGRVDAGFASYTGTSAGVNPGAGSWNGIQGGLNRTNLVGLKGEEDLGSGLKALYNYEFSLNTDGGASAQGTGTTGLEGGSRIATLGLAGGFGTVKLGRDYTPFFSVVAAVDPFATSAGPGSATIIHPLAGSTVRYSSSVAYTSPSFSGLTLKAMYGFGEAAANAAIKQNSFSFNAIYGNGPLVLALAHINNKDMVGAVDVKSTLVGGMYNLGVANLGLAYNKLTTEGDVVEHGDWHFGVTAPMGAGQLQFAYNKADDKNGTKDASHWAVGYSYDLSKRTAIYTQYGKVSNKNGAQYGVNGSGMTGLLSSGATAAGFSAVRESGLVFGARHTF
jgi:predicted porin